MFSMDTLSLAWCRLTPGIKAFWLRLVWGARYQGAFFRGCPPSSQRCTTYSASLMRHSARVCSGLVSMSCSSTPRDCQSLWSLTSFRPHRGYGSRSLAAAAAEDCSSCLLSWHRTRHLPRLIYVLDVLRRKRYKRLQQKDVRICACVDSLTGKRRRRRWTDAYKA